MPVTEIGDPRLQALFGASDPREAGVRPTVRLPRRGLPPLALAAAAVIAAVLLFSILNARRLREAEPSVGAPVAQNGPVAWASPPTLYVPPVYAPETAPTPEQQKAPAAAVPGAMPAPAPAVRPAPQVIYAPQPAVPLPPPPMPQQQPRVSSGAPLVIDNSGPADGRGGSPAVGSLGVGAGATTRVRASAFANRSTTVPQGYLIPAVLETGFDSTKPGFARALVSRDVSSFDGKNVLIPRGSRLVGEYRSEVAQGQSRAIIIWTRLIRPDGMTIAMDSPAVDTLGRGGVAAAVNTHFFARLGDALLQSTIGIGQALASRAVTGPVVVLPGTVGTAATQAVPTNSYVPTLTVPAGKSISVFVAHDLDFSAAGEPR